MLKKGWKYPKGISDPLLSRFSLLQFFFLSFLFLFSVRMHRKRREFIVAEVQSSCAVWAIISPSSYLLEFDGKHWLHHSTLSLLFLFLSPPSLCSGPSSLYMVDGWLLSSVSTVSTGGDLNHLFAHPLCFAPCLLTWHFRERKQKQQIGQIMLAEKESYNIWYAI